MPSVLVEALSDDLNTAELIVGLHALHKSGDHAGLKAALLFLGLYSEAMAQGHALSLSDADQNRVEALVAERIKARTEKNFAESDRLRDELLAMGIVIKDSKAADGSPVTVWDVKR